MRRTGAAIMLTMTLFLAGCGHAAIEDVEVSTVTVDDAGVVTQRLIEDFDTEVYDASELKEQVNSLISAYNAGAGEEAVQLNTAEVKNDQAVVQLTYASDDDYRGFNQVDFYAGSVEEAVNEGYGFSGDFIDASGEDAADGVIPDTCLSDQVIIIREPMAVLVPGTITYVSKNMTIEDGQTAVLAADEDAGDAAVTTEAYGYVIYHVDTQE